MRGFYHRKQEKITKRKLIGDKRLTQQPRVTKNNMERFIEVHTVKIKKQRKVGLNVRFQGLVKGGKMQQKFLRERGGWSTVSEDLRDWSVWGSIESGGYNPKEKSEYQITEENKSSKRMENLTEKILRRWVKIFQ